MISSLRIAAEDMAIQQVPWNGRHARDILAVQDDALDLPNIERWCREHGTLNRLNGLRRSIAPI
jgi:hypothetical protein